MSYLATVNPTRLLSYQTITVTIWFIYRPPFVIIAHRKNLIGDFCESQVGGYARSAKCPNATSNNHQTGHT